MSFQSHFITCAGLEIHYTEWGYADAPVVVAWHGLARTGRDMDELAEHLAPNYRVICPDSIGRGLSQWSQRPEYEYCLAFYARIAAQLFDQLGIGQAHWVGTSMGGAGLSVGTAGVSVGGGTSGATGASGGDARSVGAGVSVGAPASVGDPASGPGVGASGLDPASSLLPPPPPRAEQARQSARSRARERPGAFTRRRDTTLSPGGEMGDGTARAYGGWGSRGRAPPPGGLR